MKMGVGRVMDSLELAGELGAKAGQEGADCSGLVGGLGEVVGEAAAGETDRYLGVDLRGATNCGDEGACQERSRRKISVSRRKEHRMEDDMF